MTLRAKLVGLVLIVTAFVAAISIVRTRLESARTAAIVAEFRASNAIAERDTTRLVLARSRALAAVLGDSLRLYQRSVLQLTQHGNALDRALNVERRAQYQLATVIDSLHLSATVVLTRDAPTQHPTAHLHLRHPPYTIDAELTLPDSASTAQHSDTLVGLDLHVVLDTLTLGLRLSCGAEDQYGIRAASIEATAPTWAAVRFNRVEQAPEICSPRAVSSLAHESHVRGIRPFLGVGRTLTPPRNWAIVLGLGISF
jgi:hypothetical protein